MGIIRNLAKNIFDEFNKTLDGIYNHRKAKLGLVSAHNQLISSLQRKVNEWYEEQVEWDKKHP